jgi:CotH kinase protein
MLRLRTSVISALLALGLAAVGCESSKDEPSSQPASRAGSGGAGRGGSSGKSEGGEDVAGTGGGNAGRGGAGGAGRAGSNASGTGGSGGSAGTGSIVEAGSGGSSGSGSGADSSAELFDPDTLVRFDIELPAASMTALNADPDTYVQGTLRYDGETITNVGIRIKGEATKRTLEQKAAFKIKFDEFVDKQEFHGLRRLTLNNMVEDPSFLAERLAYHMFRAAKLPAPRANSALVYLNGEYLGVYANIETEDKTFLRRWFPSDAGNLYEEGESDFEYGHEMYFDLETNETKNDRSDLTRLFAALLDAKPETYLQDIDGSLDTEHFLRFSAMEAAVDQWDMYAYTFFYPNNFRIYDDPATGKFVFLPWGMDLALKPFLYTGRAHISIYELSWYEDNPDHAAPNAHVSSGLIFKNCLASPTCKAKYTDVVREIVATFDAVKLDVLAEKYYEQIKPHVYEETRKELTNEEFDKAYQSLLATIRTRTAALRKDLGE